MSTFNMILKDADIAALHLSIDNGSQRYICCTKTATDFSDFSLQVTDGIEVWSLVLENEDVDTQKDLHNLSSSKVFFNKIK